MSHTPSDADRAPRAPMTPARLRALLDAYGARVERWPDDERESALALLAVSADAQAERAAAARIDALLDTIPAPQPSGDLIRRALAGAPAARPLRRSIAWRGPIAVAAGLAAAAAVLFWLVPRRETTRHESFEQYATSYQGAYTTPTDVLLVPPGFDLSRTAPAVGCTEKGLACSIADGSSEKQSRLVREGAIG